MHSNSSLANVLTPLLAAATLSTCVAQTSLQAPVAQPRDPRLEGLPPFLLPVPGGTVEMGLTAQQLFDAACQTAFPSRPAVAPQASASVVETAMRRTASTLGRRKVEVEPFLLAKGPVKNSEYEIFVRRSRDPESGMKPVRPPFGWWRYGRKDDYEKKLPEINQRFPSNPEGPVLYWKQEGHALPYELKDDRGNSIADHPVAYISYIDANEFAASLGMRLPLEAEWTRAARGDASITWPWGDPADPAKDVYIGDKNLQQVRLYSSKDKTPKPVGTVETATGPFGHLDMFASIWQLVAGVGYYPINGTDDFESEWKALQKDKQARELLKAPPAWKDTRVVAKGGSWLSGDDPIQLLIDQRAPMRPDDVLESVGFRLAKSLRPGYDTLFSRLRGVYNRAPFVPDQDIDLTQQKGVERYEIGADGFPTAYHTVSFAPTNWLSKEKRADLRKLFEQSHSTPLVLGALVTTEKIAGAATKGAIFTVLYRAEGMPRELEDAIKRGYKEVQADLKAAERAAKNGKPAPEGEAGEEKDGEKKKKDDWEGVLRKYGLTRKDLEPKGADDLEFVRIDGVEIKTDRAAFLLHGNDGKVVAAIPAPNARPAAGKPFPTDLEFVDGGDGKAVARFHIGVPLSQEKENRVADLHFHLPLETPAPTPEKAWR